MSIRTVRMCECECVGGCVGVCVCECVGGCVCTCECVTRVQHHKHNPLCVGDAVISSPCLVRYVPIAHVSSTRCNKHTPPASTFL